MGFSGAVGRAVDLRSERKWGMILCLMGNNFSIIASCGLFAVCLSIEGTLWIYTLCLILGMIFCSSYRVFVMAEKNLSARDWMLVLLSDREEGRALARCSVVSLVAKSALLSVLYNSNERLHVKEETDDKLSAKSAKLEVETSSRSLASRLSAIFNVLATYYAQSVFPAAFGMALLFMTVLGFDGLAIGYGESVGLPESIIGLFRSFGSAAGIAGAIMYAVFERKFGVLKTGMIGMILQEVCLVVAVVSIWLPGSPWNPSSYFDTLTWSSWWSSFINSFAPSPSAPTASPPPPSTIGWSTWTTSDGASVASIFAFLIGIATARFGLWMADLAITHIMQIATPESQRNTVFGVHNAICQAFSVMKDLLVIVFPDPSTFGICIIISFAFVCTGFAAYIYFVVKVNETIQR
ncbi:hypothetical protein PENTCL1PPCAC_15954, partial [Pristionchus entomophagus]